jgi:hypothetical protein
VLAEQLGGAHDCCSEYIDRMIAISSTISDVCGIKFETGAPDCPQF